MFTLYAATLAAHAQGLRYEAQLTGSAFPSPVTLPLLAVEAEVVSNATVSSAGSGGGGQGQPQARPVVLRRTPDAFSADLANAISFAGAYDVHVRALGDHPLGEGDLVLFELHLSEAVFTGLRAQLSTNGAAIEKLELVPDCIEATSSSYDAQGELVRSTSFEWSFLFNIEGCPE